MKTRTDGKQNVFRPSVFSTKFFLAGKVKFVPLAQVKLPMAMKLCLAAQLRIDLGKI